MLRFSECHNRPPHRRRPCRRRTPWHRWPRRQKRSSCPGGGQIEGLPATIRRAGPQAAERTVEFFTAQIRNPHTRAAYGTAVTRFFTWCDAGGLALAQLSPIAVATYIEEMQRGYRAPTIKQHLAAIRRLFDWLVTGQVMPTNPATSVRGPTHVVRTGKTPVLQPAEARLPLDTIDTSTLPRPARSRAAGRDGLQLCARLRCRRHARRGLLPAGQALVAAAPGKRGQAPRRTGPPQSGGLSRRLSRRGRDRGRERRAPVALDAAGGRAQRAPDKPGGCVPDDQAARHSRRARSAASAPLPTAATCTAKVRARSAAHRGAWATHHARSSLSVVWPGSTYTNVAA